MPGELVKPEWAYGARFAHLSTRHFVGQTDLSGPPICGTTVHDGKLYIAQATSAVGLIVSYNLTMVSGSIGTSGSTVISSDTASTLTVQPTTFQSCPASAVGSTATQVTALGWNPALSALWPSDTVLVWAAERSNPVFYFRGH